MGAIPAIRFFQNLERRFTLKLSVAVHSSFVDQKFLYVNGVSIIFDVSIAAASFM